MTLNFQFMRDNGGGKQVLITELKRTKTLEFTSIIFALTNHKDEHIAALVRTQWKFNLKTPPPVADTDTGVFDQQA